MGIVPSLFMGGPRWHLRRSTCGFCGKWGTRGMQGTSRAAAARPVLLRSSAGAPAPSALPAADLLRAAGGPDGRLGAGRVLPGPRAPPIHSVPVQVGEVNAPSPLTCPLSPTPPAIAGGFPGIFRCRQILSGCSITTALFWANLGSAEPLFAQ